MTYQSPPTLAALGEFGLISRISAGVSVHGGVITGIGDDAAVTALTPGMQLLASTDMLLEDVHFRRAWHDPYTLGRKSLAVSISDIAAMGGIPRWALLSMAVPADLPLAFMDEFIRGFLAMASEHLIVLTGGDTCTSRSGLTVSVTILGEQFPDLIVRRSGAVPGDDIWVTGAVGDAALALASLERGTPVSDELAARLLDPAPRVTAALALAEAGLATAMVDVSDGLLADFRHIAEQSGGGGTISIAELPFSAAFLAGAPQSPAVRARLGLSGGEDYELCFTAGSHCREKIIDCMKKCGVAVTRIGIVTGSTEVTAVYGDGSHYRVETEGFKHFT